MVMGAVARPNVIMVVSDDQGYGRSSGFTSCTAAAIPAPVLGSWTLEN